MYKRIQRGEERQAKRDRSLLPHIIGVIVLSAILVIPFFNMGRAMYRYQTFKQDLAESMTFAEHQGTISQSDADRFYTLIVDAGMGKPQQEVPESGGTRYEFGDGSTLELWPVDIDGDPQNPGTLIRYTRSDGDVFCYDTDRIDYQLAIDTLTVG